MQLEDIRAKTQTAPYDFLRQNEHLGDKIVLLGLGGSHAYGTSNEQSDVDIRGVAVNARRDILLGRDFEQVVDVPTDTTVYSFDKIVKLLCSCNPNTIELLGLKPEHYLYLSPVGERLLANKRLFLSRLAIHSFGGYANAQLRRLENKSAREASQTRRENHILQSIRHAAVDYKQKYFPYTDDEIRLYLDASAREGFDSEIYMDVALRHYPLRDFKDLWSEMHSVVRSYEKIGKRNENAIAHNKLGKHMMHLVRLYYMCFDILEKGEIVTYREAEHDLLMSIRDGAFLDADSQPTPEFYELLDALEQRLDYAGQHTDLPESVDMRAVEDFVVSVNGDICRL